MSKGMKIKDGPKQSITVKPEKDTMAKNVTDHMGSKFSNSPGKVAYSGGNGSGKKGKK